MELGPGGLLGGKERKGRSTKTVVECKREGLVSLICSDLLNLFFASLVSLIFFQFFFSKFAGQPNPILATFGQPDFLSFFSYLSASQIRNYPH